MIDSQNGKTTELIWAHQKPFTATKAHCYRCALMEKSIDSLQSYIRSLDSPCHCAVNIKASSLQPIVSQSNGAAVVPLFHVIHSSRIFAVDRFEKNENNTSSSTLRFLRIVGNCWNIVDKNVTYRRASGYRAKLSQRVSNPSAWQLTPWKLSSLRGLSHHILQVKRYERG